jgi:molybdenum cofactor synthesis domain-containing protein
MNIKKIKVEDAIGLALAHDLTQIIPGKFKGAAFKRGYRIQKEDIIRLKAIGKENIYILELSPGEIHEDEAAINIAEAVATNDFFITEPCEGKISIKSRFTGLLKVNKDLLYQINSKGDIILATLRSDTLCQPGTVVAATRIIPLVIEKTWINAIAKLCQEQGKVLSLRPLKSKKVGIVITGNEIYHGIIKDSSGDIIQEKLVILGSEITKRIIVPDNPAEIAQAIRLLQEAGNEVILVTGGMSVDPDDVTVEGVKEVKAKIIFYGVPILPGSMFLYALLDNIPILGIPACVIYHKATALDIILPKILAEETLTKDDISMMGYGGLCLHCNPCHFPACPFGKN